MKERLAAMSFEAVVTSPEEFGALIKTEIAKWRRVVDGAKMKKLNH